MYFPYVQETSYRESAVMKCLVSHHSPHKFKNESLVKSFSVSQSIDPHFYKQHETQMVWYNPKVKFKNILSFQASPYKYFSKLSMKVLKNRKFRIVISGKNLKDKYLELLIQGEDSHWPRVELRKWSCLTKNHLCMVVG